MIPESFEYFAPQTLPDAFALLQQHGEDAKILAGGHSLIPMMKRRRRLFKNRCFDKRSDVGRIGYYQK